jgi:hypothetical protein
MDVAFRNCNGFLPRGPAAHEFPALQTSGRPKTIIPLAIGISATSAAAAFSADSPDFGQIGMPHIHTP